MTTRNPTVTCEHCGDEFDRPYKYGPTPKYCSQTHRQRAFEIRKTEQLEATIKKLRRENRKLQGRLNRIANLMPGRQRIWRLDHVAMLFDIEADFEEGAVATQEMRDLAVLLRRLEWDLGEMRDAVRGDTRRAISNRNDPTQWKGPRP